MKREERKGEKGGGGNKGGSRKDIGGEIEEEMTERAREIEQERN